MNHHNESANLKAASLCARSYHDPALGMSMPIQNSTSYFYLDKGPQPYPRYFNSPNQVALGKKLAAMEHAESGLIFSSGMAAISSAVMSVVSPGDHVLLLQGLYGGSHAFLVHELTKWGVEFDFGTSVEQFRGLVRENTVLAYIETPTNPCMGIVDLKALAELAEEANFVTIVDNTFASPINQNPIDHGIDLVIHSGTKFLGGHSDLSSGVAVGPKALMDGVLGHARMYGGNLNANSCFLLDRSIKTLDVRVQRQNSNAMKLAEFLQGQSAISRVMYPGLESDPGHDVAVRQMSGFGGMICFELVASINVRDFLRRLKVIAPAYSLGGVETTVTVPVFTSHKEMPAKEREACGVTPRTIRLSVGVEDADDLITDLESALG